MIFYITLKNIKGVYHIKKFDDGILVFSATLSVNIYKMSTKLVRNETAFNAVIDAIKDTARTLADEIIDGLNKKCCEVKDGGCGKPKCDEMVVNVTYRTTLLINCKLQKLLSDFVGLILIGSDIEAEISIDIAKPKKNKKVSNDVAVIEITARRMPSQ